MMGDPSVDATRLPQLKVAIAELADNLKLKGSSAWCSVAGHLVFYRFVKLPPVQGDKIGQIVEFEARQQVPFPLNEVAWDYAFTGEDVGEREVLIVAMKMDALNEINEVISSNGIKTLGMDMAPSAVFNAFRHGHKNLPDEPVLLSWKIAPNSVRIVVEDKGPGFTPESVPDPTREDRLELLSSVEGRYVR